MYKLIDELKKVDAIQHGNFILKSGQTSNIYIDIRKAYSSPSLMTDISKKLEKNL